MEFRTYRNRQVLRQNTVLGVITVDGTRPLKVVADTLYSFLRRDVRNQLLKAGIIPPAPGGRAAASDSVGSISGDRWFEVLDDVRRAGAAAQVIVRAAADLRAADPPTLLFEVNPIRDVSSTRS